MARRNNERMEIQRSLERLKLANAPAHHRPAPLVVHANAMWPRAHAPPSYSPPTTEIHTHTHTRTHTTHITHTGSPLLLRWRLGRGPEITASAKCTHQHHAAPFATANAAMSLHHLQAAAAVQVTLERWASICVLPIPIVPPTAPAITPTTLRRCSAQIQAVAAKMAEMAGRMDVEEEYTAEMEASIDRRMVRSTRSNS